MVQLLRFQKANISLITGWKNENNSRIYIVYIFKSMACNNYFDWG